MSSRGRRDASSQHAEGERRDDPVRERRLVDAVRRRPPGRRPGSGDGEPGDLSPGSEAASSRESRTTRLRASWADPSRSRRSPSDIIRWRNGDAGAGWYSTIVDVIRRTRDRDPGRIRSHSSGTIRIRRSESDAWLCLQMVRCPQIRVAASKFSDRLAAASGARSTATVTPVPSRAAPPRGTGSSTSGSRPAAGWSSRSPPASRVHSRGPTGDQPR